MPIALVAGVLFVVYMNIENRVIQSAIVGRSVDLTPPTTKVAAFVGGAIGGIPGALIATPLVGASKQLILEARGRRPPEPDVRQRERVGLVRTIRSRVHNVLPRRRGSGQNYDDVSAPRT